MDEQKVKEILEKIKRTAEIVLEHQNSRAFKNSIINLGAESIIAMSNDALAEIEKQAQ